MVLSRRVPFTKKFAAKKYCSEFYKMSSLAPVMNKRRYIAYQKKLYLYIF
jgi:hypothetical protein